MGRAGRVQLPCSTTAISEHKTGKDLQDHQFRQGLSSQCLTLHILKTSGNQKNLGGWQSSLNTHRRKVSPPQPSANAGTDGSRLPAGAAPLPLAPDPACARGAKPGIASPPPAPRPWRLPVEPLEPSGRGKWRAGPGPARSGPEEAGPGTSPPPWAPRDGRDQELLPRPELWPTAGTGGFSRPAGCEGRPGARASPPRGRWGTGRISFPRLPGCSVWGAAEAGSGWVLVWRSQISLSFLCRCQWARAYEDPRLILQNKVFSFFGKRVSGSCGGGK